MKHINVLAIALMVISTSNSSFSATDYHNCGTSLVCHESSPEMWQDEPYLDTEVDAYTKDLSFGKVQNLYAAKQYCDIIELGGYTDWRLPTISELKATSEFYEGGSGIDPGFSNVPIGHFWSETESYYPTVPPVGAEAPTVYTLHTYEGYDQVTGKGTSFFVRCIRGIPASNHHPLARDDFSSTLKDRPVTIAVLANDNDPDGDALTIVSAGVFPPIPNGTVSIVGDNLHYEPTNGFFGTDEFLYEITDGNGGSWDARVTVNVLAINETNNPPIAIDDDASTTASASVLIDVLANDVDPDGDPLVIVGFAGASYGGLLLEGNQLRYTPQDGFVGTDSFSYTVEDDSQATDTATVTIHVGDSTLKPDISLNPSSYNFGTVPTGDTSSWVEFSISNVGLGTLNISQILLGDNRNFGLDLNGGSLPCASSTPMIEPGDSCTVLVRFEPEVKKGTKATDLKITSNDPDERRYLLPLSGTVGP